MKRLKPIYLQEEIFVKIESFIVLGVKDRVGEELFKDEANYSNERLQEIVDDMIKCIKMVQRKTIYAKKGFCNFEMLKLNVHKDINRSQQRS